MSLPLSIHPLRCLLAGLVAWLLLAAGGALAEPKAESAPRADAVLQFLHDRGFVRQAEPPEVLRQASDLASELVLKAMNFLGVPYRRGGNSADEGFDCSGFTRYVFESTLGLVLPRRADEQAQRAGLLNVPREELRPGDLVFFNTMRRAFSHVGIYVGEGRFIHAPRSGAQVRIEDMREAYWQKRYNGARRAPPATGSPPQAVTPAVTPAVVPAIARSEP